MATFYGSSCRTGFCSILGMLLGQATTSTADKAYGEIGSRCPSLLCPLQDLKLYGDMDLLRRILGGNAIEAGFVGFCSAGSRALGVVRLRTDKAIQFGFGARSYFFAFVTSTTCGRRLCLWRGPRALCSAFALRGAALYSAPKARLPAISTWWRCAWRCLSPMRYGICAVAAACQSLDGPRCHSSVPGVS